MKKLLLKAMLVCMISNLCVGTALAADSDWELDSANGAIHRYNGSESDLVIPETIMGITITSIGQQAFTRAGQTLTSITMPDTITSIGEKAFENCRLLTTVNFSQNLERIGERAFSECSAVTQWIFPDSLQYVSEKGGFGGNPSYIRMPTNTVSGSFEFGFAALTQIDIPDQFVGTLRYCSFNVALMNEVTLHGGCSLEFITLDYLEPDETGNYVQNKEKREELSDSDFVFKVYNNTPAHYYCIDKGFNFELLGEWVQPTAGSSSSTSTPSTGSSSSSSGSSSSATEESSPIITLAIIGGVVVVLSVGVVAVVMKKK